MIHSMTAYASRVKSSGNISWSWEMRSVNARGLDVKLRLPDSVNAVETPIRAAMKGKITRGTVSLSLRLAQDEEDATLKLDHAQLDRVLTALDEIQDRALDIGVTLAQPSTADVLGQRGVISTNAKEDGDSSELVKLLSADFGPLLDDFLAMRKAEGDALQAVIERQLNSIADLVVKAEAALQDRATSSQTQMKDALSRVMDEGADVDPDRLAQELALIAVKQDVTEEIDRLKAHVAAARDMLQANQPVGRKLDFLSQEFNREANTLCAKSQYAPLTAIGIELKSVIDQMREQVQNVE